MPVGISCLKSAQEGIPSIRGSGQLFLGTLVRLSDQLIRKALIRALVIGRS